MEAPATIQVRPRIRGRENSGALTSRAPLAIEVESPWRVISELIAALRGLCPKAVPLTVEAHRRAITVAERYGYSFRHALVIAAALEAHPAVLVRCGLFVAESFGRIELRGAVGRQ